MACHPMRTESNDFARVSEKSLTTDRLGCDSMQGYLIGRPMNVDVIRKILRTQLIPQSESVSHVLNSR